MLREIYFRDPSDPKFDFGQLEVTSDIEAVLNKIRMILYTNKGDVLGEPDLGLDLESELFKTSISESRIRDKFYAQLAKYIPERNFLIEMELSHNSDGVKDSVHIYIKINGQPAIGLIS